MKVGCVFLLQLLLDLNILAPRGTIVVDNSLWYGRAYLTEDNFMIKFNKKVTEDPRVQQVNDYVKT